MKKIVATPAPRLQKSRLYWAVLVYAGAIVVATVGLLFMLDEVVDWVIQHGVGGGRAGVIAVLVTAMAGVFSMPYLLRMAVSPLMRIVSFMSGFVLVAGWLLGAWWCEINMGRSVGTTPILLAHSALLLSLASAWIVGVPVQPLKKRR